jgi:CDP-diacylglycerol--glycerol-3-phosphate 3-phosphatidyltransferase
MTQIPNALTLARFALIPPFVVLVLDADRGHSVVAAVVFGVAAITDQVDGYLARRWQVESEFGKYADPLADRLMIDAAVVLLWLADRLPIVALLIVLVRDVILVLGSKVATRRGYVFEVTFLGKTATWVLYAALVGVLVTRDGADWPLAIFWVGVAFAAIAGLGYLMRAGRMLR